MVRRADRVEESATASVLFALAQIGALQHIPPCLSGILSQTFRPGGFIPPGLFLVRSRRGCRGTFCTLVHWQTAARFLVERKTDDHDNEGAGLDGRCERRQGD